MTKKATTWALITGMMCPLVLASAPQASEALEDAKQPLASAPDVYRTPPSGELAKEDLAKSCRELEQEMRVLVPQTYSYKPGFYDDPVHGTALWLGITSTVAPIVSYGIFGYSGYVEHQENKRIHTAQDRIGQLRQLKAEKRCFES